MSKTWQTAMDKLYQERTDAYMAHNFALAYKIQGKIDRLYDERTGRIRRVEGVLANVRLGRAEY